MKKFQSNLLQPKNGQLDAVIFENSYLTIPQTLFFQIQIALNQFNFENLLIDSSITLNFIRLNIKKLIEIENQVFQFPINPVDGYIDGSIYLFGVHNPFDVKKIEFGEFHKNSIEATLVCNIDFEYENTGYEKIFDYKLKTSLLLGKLSIDQYIPNLKNYNPADFKSLVAKFASLDDYEEPKVEGKHIIFKMKDVQSST